MTLSSMTGFARSGGEFETFRWNFEVKSVNNKGLEVRVRIPSFLDGFDLTLKREAGKALSRGSVFVNLSVDRTDDAEEFVVNETRLKTLIDIAQRHAAASDIAVDGLLGVRGVVELVGRDLAEGDRAALEVKLIAAFREVLSELQKARRDEGAHMQSVLQDQLAAMRKIVDEASSLAGDRVSAMQQRFESQLARLQTTDKPVSDERLAQEIAMLAVKADVQEEIDRLHAHFDEAEKLLNAGKPVGRRLDFLCQEFNREANTLCSKSGDTELTGLGLDLKVLIDQFREQVQNIE